MLSLDSKKTAWTVQRVSRNLDSFWLKIKRGFIAGQSNFENMGASRYC